MGTCGPRGHYGPHQNFRYPRYNTTSRQQELQESVENSLLPFEIVVSLYFL